jgi:hypothetical protein
MPQFEELLCFLSSTDRSDPGPFTIRVKECRGARPQTARLVMPPNIDEVVAFIKSSKNIDTAKARLASDSI